MQLPQRQPGLLPHRRLRPWRLRLLSPSRLFAGTRTAASNVKTTQPSFVAELALKGISGTRERPLAIINNQTFAPSEENDVVTGTRHVRIRCVEINVPAETVIIQIGNERRELRLRQGK